jgi:5'-3' exoribonuclease 2
LDGLAKQEDAIFKRRKEQEDRREANSKRRKLYNDNQQHRGGRRSAVEDRKGGHHDPSQGLPLYPISSYPKELPRAITHDMVVNKTSAQDTNAANKSAASIIKEQLRAAKRNDPTMIEPEATSSTLGKRKAEAQPATETDNTNTAANAAPGTEIGKQVPAEGPSDTVRLWEDGYADRYYQQKFHRSPDDVSFRQGVARAYVEGLAWVLLYYFQGCPSWEWYYPYHYAPFAADFKDLANMNIAFEKGRVSKPFEQLMSVLPSASRHALPEIFHPLMTDEDSTIIDFYPEDFEVDLNGKKMAWQGVALLPFIDMPRLLAAVQSKYPLLSPAEAARNAMGRDVLLLSDNNSGLYDDISTKFYSKRQESTKFKLNPKTSNGLSGKVEKLDDYVPHGALQYPLERRAMPDLDYDRSVR